MNNFRFEFWIADINKHRDLLELCTKKLSKVGKIDLIHR